MICNLKTKAHSYKPYHLKTFQVPRAPKGVFLESSVTRGSTNPSFEIYCKRFHALVPYLGKRNGLSLLSFHTRIQHASAPSILGILSRKQHTETPKPEVKTDTSGTQPTTPPPESGTPPPTPNPPPPSPQQSEEPKKEDSQPPPPIPADTTTGQFINPKWIAFATIVFGAAGVYFYSQQHDPALQPVSTELKKADKDQASLILTLEEVQKKLEINPEDNAALIEKAELLAALNRFDEAIICYKNSLEKHPTNLKTIYGLAKVYKNRKQYRPAAELLRKAVELHPTIVWIRHDLADVLAKLRHYSEAVEVLLTFEDPKSISTLVGLYALMNKWDEAIQLIDKSIRKDPSNTQLMLQKAKILFDSNKHREALRLARHVAQKDNELRGEAIALMGDIYKEVGSPIDARKYFIRAIELLEPYSEIRKECRIKCAHTSAEIGFFEEAFVMLDRALDEGPQQGPLHAQAYIAIAKLMRDVIELENKPLDLLEPALEYLNAALKVVPKYKKEIFNQKGSILYKLGRYDEALDFFVELGPSIPNDTLAEMGQCYINKGWYQDALDCFEVLDKREIKNQSEKLRVLEQKAIAQALTLRLDESLETYKVMLRLDPTHKIALRGKALIARHFEDAGEQMDSWKRFILAYPTDPTGYVGMADLYSQTGNFMPAVEYFDKAILHDNDNIQLFIQKALSLAMANEPNGAIDVLDDALALNPTNIEALYTKSLIFTSLQRYGQAFDVLEDVLDLDPENQKAKDQQKLIMDVIDAIVKPKYEKYVHWKEGQTVDREDLDALPRREHYRNWLQKLRIKYFGKTKFEVKEKEEFARAMEVYLHMQEWDIPIWDPYEETVIPGGWEPMFDTKTGDYAGWQIREKPWLEILEEQRREQERDIKVQRWQRWQDQIAQKRAELQQQGLSGLQLELEMDRFEDITNWWHPYADETGTFNSKGMKSFDFLDDTGSGKYNDWPDDLPGPPWETTVPMFPPTRQEEREIFGEVEYVQGPITPFGDLSMTGEEDGSETFESIEDEDD